MSRDWNGEWRCGCGRMQRLGLGLRPHSYMYKYSTCQSGPSSTVPVMTGVTCDIAGRYATMDTILLVLVR